MREWLYLAEPDRALRLWYKRLPYCLTSSVNRHTHAHPFSASYKLATRWHINERGFVKYLSACKFESTIFFPSYMYFLNHIFIHSSGTCQSTFIKKPKSAVRFKAWGLMGEHYFWKIWIFMRINGKPLCFFSYFLSCNNVTMLNAHITHCQSLK